LKIFRQEFRQNLVHIVEKRYRLPIPYLRTIFNFWNKDYQTDV
jgi:hypothetical protein